MPGANAAAHYAAAGQSSGPAGQHRHLQRGGRRHRAIKLFLAAEQCDHSWRDQCQLLAVNAQLSDSGSQFSCLVTNAYGLATSTNASLKVIDSTFANDLCSGAIVISNASYTNTQSTVQATSLAIRCRIAWTVLVMGVWYQFIAPVTGLNSSWTRLAATSTPASDLHRLV